MEARPAGRPRGQDRRAAIAAAAARVLVREGFAGLGHRAVAAEAGVPLGSTTYWFTGRDDLARAAVAEVLVAERARRAALSQAPLADGVHGLAARLLDLLVPPGVGTAVFYQRWTEAARHPALAALLAEDLADLRARAEPLVETLGAGLDVGLVLALGDGRVLHALADGADRETLVDRLADDLVALGVGDGRRG